MACSKLFSGDLPEISTYIIQNLRNNFNTLYSLTLVNRFWCRLAIPLPWEDPFSIEYKHNFTSHFLETYFLFLDDNDKSIVNEIKLIKIDLNLQKPPLFNYPSLIKTLNFLNLESHVTKWLSSSTTLNQKSLFPLICSQYYYYYGLLEAIDRCNKEKLKVIYIALLKMFMKNNASLNNLYTVFNLNSFNGFLFDDIYDMILDNPKFIS